LRLLVSFSETIEKRRKKDKGILDIYTGKKKREARSENRIIAPRHSL